MANRDVVAAKKIGARYLAMKKGLNLGPWSRGVSAEEVEQGTHAIMVLKRVLTSYANGTYFSNASSQPMKAEHLLFEVPSTSLLMRAITQYEQYR